MYWTASILFVQVTMALAAPLQLPLVPLRGSMLQQQQAMHEQMLALQQFQNMLRFSGLPPHVPMGSPQPILILLPDARLNMVKNNQPLKFNENYVKKKPTELDSSKGEEDEESDTITIDADPAEEIIEDSDNNIDTNTRLKGILLVPSNSRFSVGGLISALPFLPFEINVPDSISWIYNGIAGIISGIGQNWPFRPNDQSEKLVRRLKNTHDMPIVVIPLSESLYPIKY